LPDLGGPEVRALDGLVRECLAALGRRRLLVPLPVPGPTGRAFRGGGNLVADGNHGAITFTEYLASGAARRPA
jgi:hypothetical protein